MYVWGPPKACLEINMASLQEFLSASREMGEPWPKKRKTDRSLLQWQLLERPCFADKKFSLNFHEISRDFSQNVLELREKSNTHLSPSVRQFVPFQPCMNANLQSRLLGNISFVKKWTLENKDYNSIKNAVSEFNENNNSLFIEPESWVVPAKEKEKSVDSGNISKENEFPTVNTFLNDNLAGGLIARIDSLFTDRPEFQSSENGMCSYEAYEMLNSGEQDTLIKPVSVRKNSINQFLHLCPPVCNFMKQRKLDFRSLLYEHNFFLDEKSNILSFKKETLSPTNNKFRRNKVFNHMYIPYSRNSQVVVPKLVRCVAFESFLQDKVVYNFITATEKTDSLIFNHSSLLTTRRRVISDENVTNEFLFFSKDSTADFIFSVTTNEKEQSRRHLVPSYNEILPNNRSDFSALRKESLYYLKPSLTTNFRILNTLNSVPVTSEKLSVKYPNMQMVVTMKTYIQEKNRKTFKENNVLRLVKKPANGRFRNINFISKGEYVSKYTATCSRPTVRCGNWEDGQENSYSYVNEKLNFSPFDTFKKICLNADSEEVDQILFIGKVKFSDESDGECSKGYVAVDKRIISRDSCTLTCSYISTKLFTKCSFLLEQESKDKSLYSKDTNANSQWQKYELNSMSYTSLNSQNLLACFSDTEQYSQKLIIPYDGHKDQSNKAWRSRIAVHKGRKQNGFAFQQIHHDLQYQSLYNSSRLKHPTVQNENFLFLKDILLSSRHNVVTSVIQNAEDADKVENVLERNYAGKRKQHQNLRAPSFKDQSATSVGSTNKLIVISSTMKQNHFEDAAKEHFSSAVKKKYAFELKSQFDLVLEELRMFNEISKENGNTLVYREREIYEKDPFILNHAENMVNEDSQVIYKNRTKVCVSAVGTTVNTNMVKQNEYEQCSFKDLVVKEPKQQEIVYEECTSSMSDEELFYSPPEEGCYPQNKQPRPWNSAFVYHTSMNGKMYSLQMERGNCLCDGITKIQPLKTCHGPLRVGLSRKAKPKRLHPYLK
nr:RAD51-associated protein 2 isoform X2 [Pogona vitticeps]